MAQIKAARRWLRFSLRTTLLFITAAACWLGYHVREAENQRHVLDLLQPFQHEIQTTREIEVRDHRWLVSNVPPWGPEFLHRLLGEAYFQDIACIQVTDPTFSAADIEEIVDPLKKLSRLRSLEIWNGNITDASVRSIAQLHKLERLNLSGSNITTKGIGHIPVKNGLTWLSLFDTKIDDSALKHISTFPNLEQVFIQRTMITDQGFKYLAESESLLWVALESSDNVTDEAIRNLSGTRNIEILSIGGRGFTDRSLEFAANIPTLRILVLHDMDVTAEGLSYITRLQNLVKLQTMNVPITDVGLTELSRLKGIETLNLVGTSTTAGGVARIKAELPNCSITCATK